MSHVWCLRCGVGYLNMLTPQCECAGDPPVDKDSDDFRAYVARVQLLRYVAMPI